MPDLATYLSNMDTDVLTDLLAAHPDVLAEPAPRDFAQLAERLCEPESLTEALWALNRDQVLVGQAIAALAGRRRQRR